MFSLHLGKIFSCIAKQKEDLILEYFCLTNLNRILLFSVNLVQLQLNKRIVKLCKANMLFGVVTYIVWDYCIFFLGVCNVFMNVLLFYYSY